MSGFLRTFLAISPLIAITAMAIIFLPPIRKANEAGDRKLALRWFLAFCLSLLALIALLVLATRLLESD